MYASAVYTPVFGSSGMNSLQGASEELFISLVTEPDERDDLLQLVGGTLLHGRRSLGRLERRLHDHIGERVRKAHLLARVV